MFVVGFAFLLKGRPHNSSKFVLHGGGHDECCGEGGGVVLEIRAVGLWTAPAIRAWMGDIVAITTPKTRGPPIYVFANRADL